MGSDRGLGCLNIFFIGVPAAAIWDIVRRRADQRGGVSDSAPLSNSIVRIDVQVLSPQVALSSFTELRLRQNIVLPSVRLKSCESHGGTAMSITTRVSNKCSSSLVHVITDRALDRTQGANNRF